MKKLDERGGGIRERRIERQKVREAIGNGDVKEGRKD